MSDTKKHTKNNNTAPYMKKDGRNKIDESSKNNFVIPLILLLVSAIVIVATFYEDEYKTLIANIDTLTVVTENTAAVIDATDADATVVDTEVTTTESITAEIKTTATQNTTATTTELADTQTKADEVITTENESLLATTTVDKAQTAEAIDKNSEKTAVTTPSKVQENNLNNNIQQNSPTPAQPVAHTQHVGDSANPGNNQQHYQTGVSQAREKAKQYYEMMQQRRQAYELEMQSRRQQHEAAMLAQREKRAEIYEAKKAVFASAQKDRIATKQKVEELHKKISALHEEVHQILRESHSSYDRTETNQQTHSEPEVEKM